MFEWLRRNRTVIKGKRTKLKVFERRRFSFAGLPDLTGDESFDDTMHVLGESTTHTLAVLSPEIRAELLYFAKAGDISFDGGKLCYIAKERPLDRLTRLAAALSESFPNFDAMHRRMAETFEREPHPGVRARLSDHIHPEISPKAYARMQAMATKDPDCMVRTLAAIRDKDEARLVALAAAPETAPKTREHVGFWIAHYGAVPNAASLLRADVVSSFYTLKLLEKVRTDTALVHHVAMTHAFDNDLYLVPALELLFPLDETLAIQATAARLLPATYEYEKKLTGLLGNFGGREALRVLQDMPESPATKKARLQIITRLGPVDAGRVSIAGGGGELSEANGDSASPRIETRRS